MKDREVVQKLKTAFTAALPAFPEAVFEQCSERQKGAVTEMTENKNRSGKIRAAVIAAALAAVLCITVTAVSLNGLIKPEEALSLAVKYAEETETDPALKEELSDAYTDWLVYSENIETSEADVGSKKVRTVYNISFKTCGYAYEIVMDAKTGVVYSSDRTADGDWEEMLPKIKKESEEKIDRLMKEQERQSEESEKIMREAPNYDFIRSRFEEHFGLSQAGRIETHVDAETRLADCTEKTDGYIYSAVLNADTGEIIESGVSEDPDFAGERILHEKPVGIISFDEAEEIAEAAVYEKYPEMSGGVLLNTFITGLVPEDGGKYAIVTNFAYFSENNANAEARLYGQSDFDVSVRLSADGGETVSVNRTYGLSAIREKAEEYCGLEQPTGGGAATNGECFFEDERIGKGVKVFIDPATLELISVEEYDITVSDKADLEKNEVLSADAPDGMISEAVAATVALEHSGVSENSVFGLKAELNGSVYKISFRYGLKDYPKSTHLLDNVYEIDAVSGQILKCDAITPEDYIGEDEAVEIARKMAKEQGNLSDGEAEALTVSESELTSFGGGYDYYEIRLTDGYNIYFFNIDPLSGLDLVHRRAN